MITIFILAIWGDGIIALIGLIIATILGFLLAWWLRGSKVDEWRNLFEDKERAYSGLEVDYSGSQKKAKGLEQDVYRLNNKLPALNEEISGLQSNLDNRDKIIAEFNEQDWENRYNNLNFELDKSNNDLTKLKALVDPKDKEIEDWKRKYTTADASVNDLNTQIKEWKTKYDNVTPDLKASQDEAGKLKIDMVSKNTLITELRAKIKDQVELQNSHTKLQTDFNAIQPQVEVLKGKETELEEKLANCRGKSDQLQTTNGDLLREVEELKAKLNAKPNVDANALNSEISRLKAEVEQSKANHNSLQSSNTNLTSQLAAATANTGASNQLQADLDKMRTELQAAKDENAKLSANLANAQSDTSENDKLKAELDKLKSENIKIEASVKKIEATEDETVEDKLNKIKSKAANINFDKIGKADANTKDDLKVIKGVGKVSEQKMNALGIYTYRQISKFEDNDINKVEDAIEFFPGRIKRDDWVEQAKILLGKQQSAPAPAPTPPPAPVSTGNAKQDEALNRIREKAKNIDFERLGRSDEASKDDLKRISGIGPFIETKLNALGIYRFEQISRFNDEDIDKVNDAIEFFPGRVRRDDWRGQAKGLVGS